MDKRLEPDVLNHTYYDCNRIATLSVSPTELSIAISLKRIADAQEQIAYTAAEFLQHVRNYGLK